MCVCVAGSAVKVKLLLNTVSLKLLNSSEIPSMLESKEKYLFPNNEFYKQSDGPQSENCRHISLFQFERLK